MKLFAQYSCNDNSMQTQLDSMQLATYILFMEKLKKITKKVVFEQK